MSSDGLSYRDAGVDIDAGNRAVAMLKDAVQATHGPEVLAGVGAFGGLYDLSNLAHLTRPVLAASTDGVGTKVRLAMRYGRLAGVGADLVNHCVNDILVQGASPLFFLDYVASSRLSPKDVAAVVGGMARACADAHCALLGGETAEMPGVYVEGEIDVVGTIIGAVDRASVIDGKLIRPGDAVVGLASASPHTNGYSLIRHLTSGIDLEEVIEELDEAPLDVLLRPHRSYLADYQAVCAAGVNILGMAHITGGGLLENPPRILDGAFSMHLDRACWTVPPLYKWLQRLGAVSDHEMHRVFNMGLGLLMVVRSEDVDHVRQACQTDAWVVGEIRKRVTEAVTFEPRLTC